MPVTFVRHGRFDHEPRRFRGHGVDLMPLSPDGIEDAIGLGKLLASHSPDLILSSPMTRALQTAMLVSRQVDRRVVVELDLHEWMPDDRQDWIDGTIPEAAAIDMNACDGEWPPGETRRWEPLSAVRRRVGAVLDGYADVDDLLVVTHSVVIQAMTGRRGCAHCERVPMPTS